MGMIISMATMKRFFAKKTFILVFYAAILLIIISPEVAQAQFGPIRNYFNNLGVISIAQNAQGIVYLASGALTFILRLVGFILDSSLDFSVSKFSVVYTTPGSAINTAWALVRDFVFLSFIFMLLNEAFKMIVSASKINARKIISGVILAALFINFSGFLTRAVIDLANIPAVILRDAVETVNVTRAPDGGGTPGPATLERRSITANLMSLTRINTYVHSTTRSVNFRPAAVAAAAQNAVQGLFIAIGGLLATLFAIKSLWKVTILMVTRALMFFFLTIISPIGMAGFWIPAYSKINNYWWKNLTRQAITAPVFLLMTYMLMLIANDPIIKNVFDDITGGLEPGDTAVSSGLNPDFWFTYIMVIAGIWGIGRATEKVADGTGKAVQAFVEKSFNKARNITVGTAGAIAAAPVALAGGAAVAAGASLAGTAGLAVSSRAAAFAANQGAKAVARGTVGSKFSLRAAKHLANTKYGAKAANLGKNQLKSTGVGKGVVRTSNFLTPNKYLNEGGFEGAKKERAKELDELAKSIKDPDVRAEFYANEASDEFNKRRPGLLRNRKNPREFEQEAAKEAQKNFKKSADYRNLGLNDVAQDAVLGNLSNEKNTIEKTSVSTLKRETEKLKKAQEFVENSRLSNRKTTDAEVTRAARLELVDARRNNRDVSFTADELRESIDSFELYGRDIVDIVDTNTGVTDLESEMRAALFGIADTEIKTLLAETPLEDITTAIKRKLNTTAATAHLTDAQIDARVDNVRGSLDRNQAQIKEDKGLMLERIDHRKISDRTNGKFDYNRLASVTGHTPKSFYEEFREAENVNRTAQQRAEKNLRDKEFELEGAKAVNKDILRNAIKTIRSGGANVYDPTGTTSSFTTTTTPAAAASAVTAARDIVAGIKKDEGALLKDIKKLKEETERQGKVIANKYGKIRTKLGSSEVGDASTRDVMEAVNSLSGRLPSA